MTALSPTMRRVLAVALLILAVLAVETLVVTPWLDLHAANRQRIADESALLARFERVTSQQRAETADLTRLQEQGLLPSLFLAATTDAVAAAELQALVKGAATDLGIDVTSTRVLGAGERDRPRRITVAVQLKTEFDALVRLIHRLESGGPSVRLSAIEIQATGENTRELAVRMEAYGFLRDAAS